MASQIKDGGIPQSTTSSSSSSSPSQYQNFHSFFDLPGELRSQILSDICLSPSPAGYMIGDDMPTLTMTSPHHSMPVPIFVPLSLFLTNTQLHNEASQLFFAHNIFHLNFSSSSRRTLSLLVDPKTGLFGSPAALPSRRRIRSLTIHLRRVGGHYASPLGPALDDMVLSGRLRHLQFRFCRPMRDYRVPLATHWQHSVLDDERIVRSTPFQSLLRLLADPYLESSRVLLERVHWTLWCPFHGHVERGEKAVTEGARARTEQEYLEVDVPALVRHYGGVGGQWSIVRIGERDGG